MSAFDSVKDSGFRLVPALHRVILKASGGKVLGSAFGMPVVQLYTTGRKTGQRRVTTLTAPIIDDQRVVLVASKGGDDRNPTWFLNLQANPAVDITAHGQTKAYTARVASVEEKAEMWAQIVASYKGYAGYQKRTDREIPVVICDLVSG